MEKTNVMRLLDAARINYLPHEYDETIVDGMGVAKALKEDPECVYKSLVTVNEKGEHFIFEVPVDSELNLKKAAHASHSKSISMIKLKDLLPLTGYIHGGCSPIGLKKAMPVIIDETGQLFDRVFVSAGKRGFQVEMSPSDLIKATGGIFADIMD